MRIAVALLLLLGAREAPRTQAPERAPEPSPAGAPLDDLKLALAAHKITLEPALEACAIPARVLVREDSLEYVLVNRSGNAHESLFVTEVEASQLNVALLALGARPGKNALWTARDPAPKREELLAGAPAYDVRTPEGDGFCLYVGWKENDELFFFRLEDLVRNLQSGRSMQRHVWVYLGSRSVPSREDPSRPLFLADLEGNLVNLCFFEAGSTLLTGALPECLQQNIWLPNAPLLPPSGEPVLFVFSRRRLSSCPEALLAQLPSVGSPKEAPNER